MSPHERALGISPPSAPRALPPTLLVPVLPLRDSSPSPAVMQHASWIFLGIFTFEMCVKILAYGFVAQEASYLRNPWCRRLSRRLSSVYPPHLTLLAATLPTFYPPHLTLLTATLPTANPPHLALLTATMPTSTLLSGVLTPTPPSPSGVLLTLWSLPSHGPLSSSLQWGTTLSSAAYGP